jgi:hypothetical protein
MADNVIVDTPSGKIADFLATNVTKGLYPYYCNTNINYSKAQKGRYASEIISPMQGTSLNNYKIEQSIKHEY